MTRVDVRVAPREGARSCNRGPIAFWCGRLAAYILLRMDVLFLDNDDRTMRDALEEACGDAQSLSMAVAFVRGSGLVTAPCLSRVIGRGGHVKLLAGVDFELTDLDAVAQFERPPSAARVYLHPDGVMRRVFHPKVTSPNPPMLPRRSLVPRT